MAREHASGGSLAEPSLEPDLGEDELHVFIPPERQLVVSMVWLQHKQ